MLMLTDAEFIAIERLLAELLRSTADEAERLKILRLHARVAALHDSSAALRASQDRLLKVGNRETCHEL